jgi:hypothetical protein
MKNIFNIIAFVIITNFICTQLSAQDTQPGQNAKKMPSSSSVNDKKTPDTTLNKVKAMKPSNGAKAIKHQPEENIITVKTNAKIPNNAKKGIMAIDTVKSPIKNEEDSKNKSK